MDLKPTKRFSDKVTDYAKYRPSYPINLITKLQEENILVKSSIIVDVGSGTGIFSKLLLEAGYQVIGVEPNKEMREYAEKQLSVFPNFRSVAAKAEKTKLSDNSVDVITAAQAFHWFKQEETRKEFARILKPKGYIALIWNVRDLDDPFQKDYDKLLLDYCPEYKFVHHRNISDIDIRSFFGTEAIKKFECENNQIFDFEGARGRLESSSYAPSADHENYLPMIKELQRIFDLHQTDNKIKFAYKTEMIYGKLLFENK
jgi:SAM-dependent methyltransferase